MDVSKKDALATDWQVWFGSLGGAGAWTIHLLVVALTAEWTCFSGVEHRQLGGVSVMAWGILAMSVALELVAIGAVVIVARLARSEKIRSESFNDMQQNRQFLLMTGSMTSTVFAFVIVVQSIPVFFYLNDC